MQNFSNVSAVRKEAGFEANENVAGSIIKRYLNEATAIVQSYVAKKYNLAAMTGSAKFTGSQAEFFLQQAEILYAAGSLLNKEFGYQDREDGEGDGKINDALDSLGRMVDGIVILLDSDGNEFPATSTRSHLKASGTPISNSSTGAEGQDLSRKFSMSDSIT